MFNLEQYCEELQYICNIDSGSADPDGINKVADFFASAFKDLGWHINRTVVSSLAGDYLQITNHKTKEYDVLISGHIDTVFPRGEAEKRPVRFENGVAYGPGVYDMKGADLMVLWAMRELPPEIMDALNICIEFTPDEEIGSRYSREKTIDLAKRSKVAFIMEGTDVDGLYTATRCGQRQYEIDFTGIAAHAAYLFERQNANAIAEMAHWITEIHALSSAEKYTMVNVGIANGGSAVNIVPENAHLTVGVRAISPDEFERIEQKLQDLQSRITIPSVTVNYSCTMNTPPMYPTEETKEYLAGVEKLFGSRGEPFAIKKVRCGCSDGNFIASTGTICLDTLGPCGGGSHSSKEFLPLAGVEKSLRRLLILLEQRYQVKQNICDY